MSTYVFIFGAVGFMSAAVALAAHAVARHVRARQRKQRQDEIQREAEALWARMLERLQTESAERYAAPGATRAQRRVLH